MYKNRMLTARKLTDRSIRSILRHDDAKTKYIVKTLDLTQEENVVSASTFQRRCNDCCVDVFACHMTR